MTIGEGHLPAPSRHLATLGLNELGPRGPNIACDELAGEVTAAAIEAPDEMPPHDELLQMPYEGSRAVLRIGDKWITARGKAALYRARRGPIAREYIKQRHKTLIGRL